MDIAIEQTPVDQKAPPPGPVSFEAFLEWMDEDTHAEWVDGEIIMTSPASTQHQSIRDFLLKVMSAYVDDRQRGIVISAPFLMRIPARPSGREPDLLFITTEHLDRLQPTYLDGPADLVVEIISPESDARDRGDKFIEYELSGIPEYWLIDPLRQHVDFYEFGPDRRYHAARLDPDRIYHSAVLPGFFVHEAWLWRQPLPEVDDVLLDIGGEAYARRLIQRLRERGFLTDV
jgi:Uma2 family endonuclease